MEIDRISLGYKKPRISIDFFGKNGYNDYIGDFYLKSAEKEDFWVWQKRLSRRCKRQRAKRLIL